VTSVADPDPGFGAFLTPFLNKNLDLDPDPLSRFTKKIWPQFKGSEAATLVHPWQLASTVYGTECTDTYIHVGSELTPVVVFLVKLSRHPTKQNIQS
jgi:hypothetical protein